MTSLIDCLIVEVCLFQTCLDVEIMDRIRAYLPLLFTLQRSDDIII
jgi:hypothetical protein